MVFPSCLPYQGTSIGAWKMITKAVRGMQKVLHLTHTEIEGDSRIQKEMIALSRAGYQMSGIGIALDEDVQKVALPPEIKVHTMRLASRRMTALPRTVRHAIAVVELLVKMLPAAVRARPSVIHCHDTLVLPIAALAKLMTGAKLIYDVHELESDRNGLTRVQGWLTLRFEKMLWPFVNGLITPSPSIADWYEATIGPKRTAVVMNSPEIAAPTGIGGNYLREKFDIPETAKIFLYVGILAPGRGVSVFLEAFLKSGSGSHVVFLGYGPMTSTIAELARTHANVHYHPAVSHEAVVAVASSADYGLCLIESVSLSDKYSLPNKFFEYVFAGLPVLASDFPDLRKAVTEYRVGTTCEVSVDAVSKAIARLETSDAQLEPRDLTPLGWAAQEEKLLLLYRDTLA